MAELGLEPHQFMVVSGIGQAAKLPHYTKCNTFNGLHGRTLPVATGIRLANHTMPVIVTTGDGDCYGEGGNHLIAAIRRNINAEAHMPFGGVKQTGNGHREGGWTVYDFFTEWKTVYVDYSGGLQRAQIDNYEG